MKVPDYRDPENEEALFAHLEENIDWGADASAEHQRDQESVEAIEHLLAMVDTPVVVDSSRQRVHAFSNRHQRWQLDIQQTCRAETTTARLLTQNTRPEATKSDVRLQLKYAAPAPSGETEDLTIYESPQPKFVMLDLSLGPTKNELIIPSKIRGKIDKFLKDETATLRSQPGDRMDQQTYALLGRLQELVGYGSIDQSSYVVHELMHGHVAAWFDVRNIGFFQQITASGIEDIPLKDQNAWLIANRYITRDGQEFLLPPVLQQQPQLATQERFRLGFQAHPSIIGLKGPKFDLNIVLSISMDGVSRFYVLSSDNKELLYDSSRPYVRPELAEQYAANVHDVVGLLKAA